MELNNTLAKQQEQQSREILKVRDETGKQIQELTRNYDLQIQRVE